METYENVSEQDWIQLNKDYAEVYKDLQKALEAAQGLQCWREGCDLYVQDSNTIDILSNKYRQPF